MLLSQCPRGTAQLQIRSGNPACQLASFFKTILRPISLSLKNNAYQEYCRLGTGSLWLLLSAPRVCFWGQISAIYFTETMARTCLGKRKAAIQHRSSCSIHKNQGKINKHMSTLKLSSYQSMGQSVEQILENKPSLNHLHLEPFLRQAAMLVSVSLR